jgi:hypothetical protein
LVEKCYDYRKIPFGSGGVAGKRGEKIGKGFQDTVIGGEAALGRGE